MKSIPVSALKGVGPARASVLKSEADIETVEDLLYYIPRRYLDRSNTKRIIDVFDGEEVTVFGRVLSVTFVNAKKNFLEVKISDGTDSLSGIFFGGINFFKKIFEEKDLVVFSGKVNINRKKQIVHPEFDFFEQEVKTSELLNTGRIIPLYKSSMNLKKYGLDSRALRRLIHSALQEYSPLIEEPIDTNILQKHNLPDLKTAIRGVHFPESQEQAELCRKRLAFNEIFFMQSFLQINKLLSKLKSHKKTTSPELSLFNEFINKLPYSLTSDQKKAIEDIKNDIFSSAPMNRLLQGDVGCGKTAVALATAMFHIEMNNQVAIMAPTEILARQHFNNAEKFLPDSIRCDLLTSSTPSKEKKEILESLNSGEIKLIIGTHALLQSNVVFKNLGYIIIDEQHRFGVEQRAKLRLKGENTDLLIMTATPIPRSLSMTLYGDMDVTIIKEKPGNRQEITTLAFPDSRLPAVYNSLRKYIDQGRQIYYILPLIEESEKIDLKSAIETFYHLSSKVFPDKRVAILHGKMSQKEKDEIMEAFREGFIDLLVSTTVVEVGVDVANANVMVIEHAERFGLAQLHQLRGRVGRGEHKSFCVLIHKENLSEDAAQRIKIMTETSDGFLISEKDLLLRGSGELIGTRQHGFFEFEFTDPSQDINLIIAARDEARLFVQTLDITDEFSLKDFFASNKIIKNLRAKRLFQILA